MKNKCIYNLLMTTIIITFSSTIILANSYEKVKIKTIDDYYDYLNKVGAVQEQVKVGPDASTQKHADVLIESNKSNIKEDLSKYSIISYAIAITKDNEEFQGELISDGNNTKFTYTDEYDMKHLLKNWAALNMASGQRGWYHFDHDGNMTTGFYTEKKNSTYYFMEDGVNKGMMATGQLDIDGTTYYFSETPCTSYGVLVK